VAFQRQEGVTPLERHLRPDEAVHYINTSYGFRYSPKYLAKLRSTSSRGPTFVRHGGRVYYRPSDLDAWIEQRTKALRSTSSAGRGIIN